MNQPTKRKDSVFDINAVFLVLFLGILAFFSLGAWTNLAIHYGKIQALKEGRR